LELDIPAKGVSWVKMICHLSSWASGYNFPNSLGFALGINSFIALEPQVDK
jgi:hypothetical protein